VHHAKTFRAKVCYSVDLSARAMTMLRSVRTRKGITHQPMDHGADPGAPDTVEELVAHVQRESAQGRAIVASCVPGGISFTRWLSTPFPSLSKARKVFPTLLDVQLPFPLEQCAYHFLHPVRTEAKRVETLAVAVRKEYLAARLEQFEQLGLDPEHLDQEGLAAWTQSLEERPIEAGQVRVVAVLGQDHITLVFGRGTRLLATHSSRIGFQTLFDEAAAARRLAGRTRQWLHAHFPASPDPHPVQWIWTGPGAEDERGLRALERELGEARLAFFCLPDPSYFLCRALSTRSLRETPLAVNFREGPFIHPRVQRRLTTQRRATAWTAIAAGLLLGLLSAGWVYLLDARDRALQAELTATAQKLARLSSIPRGQEVLIVRRAMENRTGVNAVFADAFRSSLTVLLTDILRVAGRYGLTLHQLSLRPNMVSARGTSEDWNSCRQLEQFLSAAGFDVTMDLPDAGADELVHFSLEGVRAP